MVPIDGQGLSCQDKIVKVALQKLYLLPRSFLQKLNQSYSAFVKANLEHVTDFECTITARWYGELPSVSGLACVFAKSR